MSFKTKDTKKAKTEENTKTPGQIKDGVGKSDGEEGDSEVPSLPLGLTGTIWGGPDSSSERYHLSLSVELKVQV